ncbi:MAG TPA: retroviral-like aspartic protease family protein [Gemmataceae bacterium]|nr:retroviral-like aspartic protease family protein [Gemmataceae bacterium]
METTTMGKVLVTAKIENMDDLVRARDGHVKPEEVRSIEVTDALVDTGATMLSLPRRHVAQLGLQRLRARQARTTAGPVTLQVYGTVRLTIQGRDCPADVLEVPDDCPVLVGQLALEALDFVVDPAKQRLIGNPEHGGEQMVDLY